MDSMVHKTLLMLLGAATVTLAGCRDDDPQTDDGATGDSGTDGADATVGVSTSSEDESASDTSPATESSGGSDDTGGLVGAAACTPTALPGAMNEGDWDTGFSIAGIVGHDGFAPTVYDFAREADGSMLVAGFFEWVGTERIEGLLRLHEDGTWEDVSEDWLLDVPRGGFIAVAVGPDGELALQTNFGEGTGPEIWVDTGDGLEVIGSLDWPARRLAWFQGQLWAAGAFFEIDGEVIPWIAVWDGVEWAAPPGGGVDVNSAVYSLLVTDDRIVVAGTFAGVGGIAAQNVASFDGTSWEAYDHEDLLGTVYGLAQDANGTLVAGGYTYGDDAGGVWQWNGTQWDEIGSGMSILPQTDVTGVISDVAFHDDELYVTGCFNLANGPEGNPDAVPAASFARWDGTTWVALDDVPFEETPSNPWLYYPLCGNDGTLAIYDVRHQRLMSQGDRIRAGGGFGGAGNVPSQALISYEPSRGQWLAEGAPSGHGINGSLRDFFVGGEDCSLYALGGLTHAGGDPAPSNVISFEGSDAGWSELGPALPSGLRCEHLAVDAEGTVRLGCIEFETGDFQLLELAGDAWTVRFELPANGDEFYQALDMTLDHQGTLWIVGSVTENGLANRGFVARWQGGDVVVDETFDDAVTRVDIQEPETADDPVRLVVGGAFTHVGDQAMGRVAQRVDGAWLPLGEGVDTLVRGLEYGRHGLYVSTFNPAGTSSALYVWAEDEWTVLSTDAFGFPDTGEVPADMTQLLEVGDNLIVTGSIFTGLSGQGRGAYIFDGTTFSVVGGNLGAPFIEAVAATADSLWFGGQIAEAGANEAAVSTVGVARYRWP